jgi:serine/threonine protein kinase
MTAHTAPQISGFQYVRPIGKGGFARVYLYEQDMPRRIVAVKVLTKSIGQMREAFETEADMMAKLASHPSVVSIYEASISSDGQPYLVMEFCPDSLGARAKVTPVPLDQVLDAGVRFAGALETAHRSGVLHRDIKPSNVLLTVTSKPALTDFGIADLAAKDTSEESEMAMSIPWSAPEVVTKAETGTIATEIWSLAATLYTFASGRPPFASRVAGKPDVQQALIKEIVRAKYPPIEGARGYEPFDRTLAHAMAKRPGERFQTMEEFGAQLQELQRHFGFDVTSLEVINEAWMPQFAPAPQTAEAAGEAEAVAPRGPVVSSIGRESRASRREEHETSTRRPKRKATGEAPANRTTLAALFGAGGTLVVLVGVYVLGRLGGWL